MDWDELEAEASRRRIDARRGPAQPVDGRAEGAHRDAHRKRSRGVEAELRPKKAHEAAAAAVLQALSRRSTGIGSSCTPSGRGAALRFVNL